MKYFFNENGILISSQKVITLFDLCSIADDIVKKHNYLVEDFIDNIL